MPRTLVYVSCAASAEVVSFRLDNDSGALLPHGRSPVPGAVDPPPTSMPLAVSPDRRWLYAGNRNPPFPVTCFEIAPDGGLSPRGTGRLAAAMAYLSVDAGGRFLFGASYHGSLLSVNALDGAGLPGNPVQALATPPKAHSILPEPENRAVYAAILGGDMILRQEFDAETGMLSEPPAPVARTAAGAGPRHLRFARNGTRLYCLNELDASLNAYERDPASGALTELQSVRLVPRSTAKLAAADLHLTPDERFLYASERSSNVIAGFSLRPDGSLNPIGTVPAEAVPRGFAIDPRGRWLVCAGQVTGRVAVYAIDPERGTLTRLAEHAAGGNANWVEIIDLPA